jgi:TrmH family RNA methyltransferase
VLEGGKIIAEAQGSGARIETVFIEPEAARPDEIALAESCRAAGARVIEVREGVLSGVLDTVTPQPIAATVARVDIPISEIAPPQLAVVLAGVSDPGNAGTLLRSAAAAGADLAVITRGSVDPYNPKTVRATAGAIFRLPVVVDAVLEEALRHLKTLGVKRWGTAAEGGSDYTQAELSTPCAILLGNEAHGIPEVVTGGLDGILTIPMPGPVESLNVAVAGSLLFFEAARQRRRGDKTGQRRDRSHLGAA